MDHRVDAVPDLDGPIAKRNESIGPLQTLFEVVVKSDGVEHP
jgi:hypothetical protein